MPKRLRLARFITLAASTILCLNFSFQTHAATNLPFVLGEKAIYDISWFGIIGGEGTLHIKKNFSYMNNEIYEIDINGVSVGWVRDLYKVDDHAFSYFDIKNKYSHRAEIQISEGSYKKVKVIEFDHKNLTATYRQNDSPPETFEIEYGSQDSFSALYALRTMHHKLKVGKSISLPLFEDKKKYDLEVRVLRKERLHLPQGMIDTIVIQPMLKTEGVFRRKGKLTIWLVDNYSLLPIRIKTKILIGSFVANLKEYDGIELSFIPYANPAKGKDK